MRAIRIANEGFDIEESSLFTQEKDAFVYTETT
jgi:hypothetical protein